MSDEGEVEGFDAWALRVASQRRPSDGPGLAEAARADLPYATPPQRAAIEALLASGSVAGAAASLEMHPERLRGLLSEAQRRAARSGSSREHDHIRDVPPGYHLRGTSTLYGADGTPKLQWVKTARDQEEQIAALLDAIEGAVELYRGAIDPAPPSLASHRDDLLVVYPMGDPHIGMYAWHEEAGEDFDLDIASRNLATATRLLVDAAPPARVGHILNLGDFFHADNAQNRTARSGHALDVDGRFAKVQRVGMATMRACIDSALRRHELVRVTNVIGNHDDHTAILLSHCLAALYEREPRVTIEQAPAKFHYYRHGRVLYGVTHGDTCKVRDLESVMSADRPADWGETRYRHWYTGHVHHDSAREFRGVTVETFRTLAARDAWHTASGYRSDRDMKADVWHSTYGRVGRHIVGIEQVIACAS